jgi:hypothetical protein
MNMLLVFSSGLRSGYLRNVLDCLCYPAGHVIHFRYRNELIEVDPRTRRNIVSTEWAETIGPVEGLIVYADSLDLDHECDPTDSQHEFRFFPVRFVQILRPVEHGNWSYIPLVLGPYPRYGLNADNISNNAEFNNGILRMKDRPKRQGHSAGEGYFVVRGEPTLERIVQKDQSEDVHDAWEATIREIGETLRFKDKALFYRLDHLYEAKEDWPRLPDEESVYTLKKVKPSYHSVLSQCIYNVSADVDFRLRIITHQGSNLLPNDPQIKLNADPLIFTGETTGTLLVDSPYNEESLFLRSKRATESSLTAIELEAIEGPESMLAAKPRLLIKVDPRFTQYLLGIAALLAAGQLLLAVNQDLLNFICVKNPVWVAVAKFFGFVATFLGVGLAFRKMKIP